MRPTCRPSASAPVTPTAPVRCGLCGRSVHGICAVCFCCRTVASQLCLPLVPLVALCEYRLGDRTHHRLRSYKDGPVAEVRETCRRALVQGLVRWIDDHGMPAAIAGDAGVVVTPVPSSRRPGRSPVGDLVDGVPGLAERHIPLLARGPGRVGHLQANRDAFSLAPGVDRAGLSDLSVLVVDDTTTTGAAAQSAAAALRMAGAHVVGVLVLGRALPPRGYPMGT